MKSKKKALIKICYYKMNKKSISREERQEADLNKNIYSKGVDVSAFRHLKFEYKFIL